MYASIDLQKLRKENPNYISKNPFEHQKDSFEKLSQLFTFKDSEPKSGILVLPTGAGKTFTSVNWICRNVLTKKCKVLWLANTGHLLVQAFEAFHENILEAYPQREFINIRVVSSDPLHSQASKIQLSDDVLIITTQTAISNFNSQALDGFGERRKTAFERFLESCRHNRLFVVLDEAHHAPAFGCRNLLIGGGKFKQGIRHLIPAMYLLGLTATPTYSDERRRGWLWEIFTSKIIYQADTAELVKQNILAVPDYIQRNTGEEFEVDDSTYDAIFREHKDLPDHLIEKITHDSGRNDYIINEYLINHQNYSKTIIFTDRWFQCEYIKTKLLERAKEQNLNLKVDAVYSHIDADADNAVERNHRSNTENSKILKDFKDNKIDVLVNVKILSEGIDVPDVKTVFITRQTTSSIFLTQMIGRALRGKKAGGGADKETANIVLFVDNWKRVINFANPEGKGGLLDKEPKTRGRYPIELISIQLIEELARKIENGLVFSDKPFLDFIPIGWYETEVLVTVEDETNLFKEFVIVFENSKQNFENFIHDIENQLESEWENDILDEDFANRKTEGWKKRYFTENDNKSNTLDLDLIKICRHLAQSKRKPVFYTFEERNKHDLSKIASDLLHFNEFIVWEQLNSIYQNPELLWQTFYKSFERFKTAFDAERNRAHHLSKFGSAPIIKPEINQFLVEKQRELTEAEKEQVFRRDNFTCLCCGKKKEMKRRIKFEVDHIIPFKFGGETSLANSQTLCKTCNKEKGINELNFRIFKTPLSAPKSGLQLFELSKSENEVNTIKRIVNIFYHCQAVAEIKLDTRPRSTYRYNWEIHLFEGNNPEWLTPHLEKLIAFIRKELKYPDLKELKVV